MKGVRDNAFVTCNVPVSIISMRLLCLAIQCACTLVRTANIQWPGKLALGDAPAWPGDTRDTRSHLGPAGSSTSVKEQSNILLLGGVYQFSGRLLHLEALGLWLDVHCMASSQTFI